MEGRRGKGEGGFLNIPTVFDALSQLEHTVERKRCNMRFSPTFGTLLNILLELYPPETHTYVTRTHSVRLLAGACNRCAVNSPSALLPLKIVVRTTYQLVHLNKELKHKKYT